METLRSGGRDSSSVKPQGKKNKGGRSGTTLQREEISQCGISVKIPYPFFFPCVPIPTGLFENYWLSRCLLQQQKENKKKINKEN